MREHRWLEDVPAFVLGALDAEERVAFEAHLRVCERCREAVREHEELVAAMAPSAEPPPELRAKVLEAALAAAPPASEPVGRPDGQGAADPSPHRARPAVGRWSPWLAAAAGIGFAMWAGLSWRGASERADTLAAEIAGARATIDTLRLARAQRDSMLSALAGADIETATLASTASEPRVRLFWNRASRQLLLTAFDLPSAPSGRTYQLWGLNPGAAPVSLGTFDTGVNGRVVALRSLPGGAAYARSAVTEEPDGGSPQPTSQPFLVGPWSSAGQ